MQGIDELPKSRTGVPEVSFWQLQSVSCSMAAQLATASLQASGCASLLDFLCPG